MKKYLNAWVCNETDTGTSSKPNDDHEVIELLSILFQVIE